MRLFLSTSSLPHSVAVTRNKTSKYLAKSRNAKTLDYHQVRYFFACERFIFYDLHKVTGLIRVSGQGSLCDQREFPGHCHSLLIDDTDKNLFDANYLQNMFFTLCNFTSGRGEDIIVVNCVH